MARDNDGEAKSFVNFQSSKINKSSMVVCITLATSDIIGFSERFELVTF